MSTLFDELLFEGPFGSHRGHPGFGLGIFQRRHYRYIADKIRQVEDPVVGQHLTDWFCKLFERDNPRFDEGTFRTAVDTHGGTYQRVEFQQRHFYYIADAVCKTADQHEKEFLADWLADVLGRTNQYFQRGRWDKFCGITQEEPKQTRRQRAR